MIRPIALVVAALFVASPLAGCGGSDDPLEGFTGPQRGVVATVLAYNTAARMGDARTVCRELLARSARAPLGQECIRRMAGALRSIDQQGIEVVDVRFRYGTAVATVVTGAGKNPRSGTLALVEEDGLWRIARVGPLPPPGADSAPR